jgi:hypothetical protein
MSEEENNDIINTHNQSFKYGIYGGLTISAILFLFQLNGDNFAPFLKLSGLLFFGVILVYALSKYKQIKEGGEIFISGMGLGTKTSLIASVTVVLVNLFLFLINNDFAFSKYSVTPDNFSNLLFISGILLFEIFVFGSLISFITLQYLKK